MNKARSRSRL